MITEAKPAEIPFGLMAELQAAADAATKGIRDPEAMRRACVRRDRTRAANQKRLGLLDFAVPTIRELRNDE